MFQRVEKTRKYLREYLAQSPYFAKNPGQFSYRYQHSLRVAAIGARIARPWLLDLGLAPAKVEEICYGIAIHVDDEADFAGEKTVLAGLIGDCDNIDRFDVYRVYELLEVNGFSQKETGEQLAWLEAVLPPVRQYRELAMSSPAATAMWRDRLDFQVNFYERLYRQLSGPSEEWPDERQERQSEEQPEKD